METNDAVAEQRLLGGHVALDFVNTRRAEGRPEFFDCVCSYHDLVAWGHHAGLLSPEEAERLLEAARERRPEADAALACALGLRAAIEGVFRTLAEGSTPPSQSVEALGEAQSDAMAHGRLVRTGSGFSWAWDDEGDLARMLWPIVHEAVELLTSGDLDRVKFCPQCGWLFYDATKNRSRRWCTMEDGCGEEVKMRRYVQRRAAGRSSRSGG